MTTQNDPRDIPTPSLNSVEEWIASDVIGSGCTRRTTKYSHKFPKIQVKQQLSTWNISINIPPKKMLNKEVSKKFLPKNGCVMGARASFPVVGDKVHTQRTLFLKPKLEKISRLVRLQSPDATVVYITLRSCL